MPIISARTQSERLDHQENAIPANRGMALQVSGPRVPVTLSPFGDQIKLLAEKGEFPITPVTGLALIDTGASVTCIDQSAAANAGLALVNSGRISSVTHAAETVPLFAGRLDIHGFSSVETFGAYGVNLESQELIALIGRDLLARCVLIYNGLEGSFSLSI